MYQILPEIKECNILTVLEKILPQKKILIVTSTEIYAKNNFSDIQEKFENHFNDFLIISDCPAENPFSYIMEFFKKITFSPDITFAVGGGSVLDLVKAYSVSKTFENLESNFYGKTKSLNKHCEVYAFPTTFGTGAEISYGAILYDNLKGIKSGIRGKVIQSDKIFLDYNLYKTAPERIKALSGFDCLTHAIETYISSKSSTLTRYQSINAIKIIKQYLPAAVKNNELAVSQMAIASLLMGVNLAFSSTCMPHRIQYVIGPLTNSSHSEGLVALYKGWIKYISKSNGKFNLLCKELLMDKKDLVSWITNLSQQLEIDLNLEDLGVRYNDIDSVANSVTGNLEHDPYYINIESIKEVLKESF